jgi:hypothetical protein
MVVMLISSVYIIWNNIRMKGFHRIIHGKWFLIMTTNIRIEIPFLKIVAMSRSHKLITSA